MRPWGLLGAVTRALGPQTRVLREVLAMDGPKASDRIPPLARVGEPTRLRTQWMALAYEKLCPIHRLRMGPPPGANPGYLFSQGKAFDRPPKAAVGA